MRINGLILSALILLISGMAVAADLHVPAEYATIQNAIDAAVHGDAIIIADGTYTGDGNRDLETGGKMISIRSQNGPKNCTIDCQGSEKDPHRAFNFDPDTATRNTVIWGLTIINGYEYFGGAVRIYNAHPTFENCVFTGNTATGNGGAISASGSDCEPLFTGCRFTENTAATRGGAAYLGGYTYGTDGDPVFTDCIVVGNNSGGSGGAFYCGEISRPEFHNCLIMENTADNRGGGFYLNVSYPIVRNCTIVNNVALSLGGGFYTWGLKSGGGSVLNSIIWGNAPDSFYEILFSEPSVSHCDVEGGHWGTNNIDADPLFVSGLDGDHYLSQVDAGQAEDSPCVNTGSDAAENLCFEVRGEEEVCYGELATRSDHVIDTGTVDMGYHYGPASALPPVSGWSWENTGELDGALRVYALCENTTGSLFAGSGSTGNVYRSDDWGGTWTNTADLTDAVHVFDLLPASDGNLYAATMAGGSAGLVFVSVDDGLSWSPTSTPAGAETVFCLLETTGGVLLAGTGPNGDVFESPDWGASWTNTGDLAGAESVNTLIEAGDGSLFAATGSSGDVFRSTDGGVNWVNAGDLAGAEHVYSLLELEGGGLIAATAPGGCIFTSQDQGSVWDLQACLADTDYAAGLALHSDGMCYVGTGPNGEVFCSADGGATWTGTTDLYGVTQALTLFSASDGHLYCGTGFAGGVFKNSGPSTIACSLTCVPDTGTLPFGFQMGVALHNPLLSPRVAAARIDVTLGSGTIFTNWRAGNTILSGGELFETNWTQQLPALGTLVGQNRFHLDARDVTPPPYNAPPYAGSGATATADCTVTGVAP